VLAAAPSTGTRVSEPTPFTPAAVGVVIPAHNEESLLPRCLDGLARAAARIALPVAVAVALDRCTDRSAEVVAHARAAGLRVRAVYPSRPGVGAARAAGMAALLAGSCADSLWLASTDADSRVPADWLLRQLRHARSGAEVVVGTVRVLDWTGHPRSVRRRYLAGYRAEPGHRHMHGANLAMSARSYLAAGGFADAASDEDVDLIERLERLAAPMVWAADLAVTTSARLDGRAPAGFADHLARLHEVADVSG
jgi:glycosyltransferase involved in cell wall biosynthesis